MSSPEKAGVPNYPPPVEAYVWLVRTAEHLHALVSRGLLPYGLTPSQYSTLKVLTQRGSMMQRDIADYLLKTGGNITMVVDNLERMELVARRKSEEDRRQTIVELTAKGRELFEEVYPGHIEDIVEVMSELSEDECAVLSTMLSRIGPEAKLVCPPQVEGSISR